MSPAPAEDTGNTQEKQGTSTEQLQGTSTEQLGRNQEDSTQSPSNSKSASSGNKIFDLNSIRKNANSTSRVQPSIRALPPYRGVSQLEEAMNDLKLYDSCLFWGKTGSVNLKPEGNSWDDDMVIQSKDPAWVRNYIEPATPTNQELLILPSVAKIERSIEVYFQVFIDLRLFLCLFKYACVKVWPTNAHDYIVIQTCGRRTHICFLLS